MKIAILLSAVALLATSCSSRQPAELTGIWVQPIPGQPRHLQGMELLPDGKAQSINMHTLLYTAWELKGSQLTLTSKSIGNKHVIPGTQSYRISRLNERTMTLEANGRKETYDRLPPWMTVDSIQGE